jgi:hypothetical protein
MPGHFGAIDVRYVGKLLAWNQGVDETYTSGKSVITVDRGTFVYRADTKPITDGTNYTFTNCAGSVTTVTLDYAGTLSLRTPTPSGYC